MEVNEERKMMMKMKMKKKLKKIKPKETKKSCTVKLKGN